MFLVILLYKQTFPYLDECNSLLGRLLEIAVVERESGGRLDFPSLGNLAILGGLSARGTLNTRKLYFAI